MNSRWIILKFFVFRYSKLTKILIFTELEDLCKATLILNGLLYYDSINLRIAWELALIKIETKFLSTFLQGLCYIRVGVPEERQYELLMLKYYEFLWKIRKYFKKVYSVLVLNNLEEFLGTNNENKEHEEYDKLFADSIDRVVNTENQ